MLPSIQNSRKEETTTTMRNKFIKITAIALLSAFALTACDDDIIAKPKGYDDNSPVINIDGFDGTVENNKFKDIYDSIRSGSLASDVLNELLYQYAVSMFGNYNQVTASKITNSENLGGETTLKAAIAGLTIDGDGNVTAANDVAKKFIKDHKAFWTTNADGKRVNDNNELVDDDAEPSPSELSRLNSKWNAIEKRIAQKMYAQISGGSYSERNVFEEERFLRTLAVSIENKVIDLDHATCFEGVLTADVEDYDVFKEQSVNIYGVDDYILHRENYQANWKVTDIETKEQEVTYIEDVLIPDIYRQLLVEQYILDEAYDTLGRTSARHISVLSISKNSNYSKGASNLMNTFVKDYIFDKDRTAKITLDTFKMVSNAWIGAFMSDPAYASTDEYAIMTAANSEYFVDDTNKYFQGTAYGDMMEEIEKINSNPAISEHESDYTGSNAYPVEVGKQIKTRELMLQDHTSTGWYIKSVGVSSLPDSIKNDLFDINVANAFNGENCVEYTYDNAEAKWVTNEDNADLGSLINVVGKVNGQLFLRNTTRIKGNPVESDLLFEENGNYYIILVEDAIRSVNLNKDQFKDADAEKVKTINTYINEIVSIVADNDTYKNLSKKHWIEEMNLKYHDQVIYDYFKGNFPELFED